MNDSSHQPLPHDLEQALRGLGELKAPQELDDRVALALTQTEIAPAELWNRVSRELKQAPQPVRRLLAFPRLAAAAAVMVLFGVGIWFSQPMEAPSSIAPWDTTLRDEYRSRALVLQVSPAELSSTALGLAGALGAPISRGQSL